MAMTEHYRCPECGQMFAFERDPRNNALGCSDVLPDRCTGGKPKRYWATCPHIRHAVVGSTLNDVDDADGH